jgi:hypothetical protein
MQKPAEDDAASGVGARIELHPPPMDRGSRSSLSRGRGAAKKVREET